MADVQKQFEKFHETIRVDFDMSQDLRDKRDIVVEKVKKYLREKGHPTCEVLLQGSYKMKTGVRPVADLEYDIDIGLRFSIRDTDYAAATVRGWVYEAVKDHTKKVEKKGPCVRVYYSDGYHLDLVTYAVWEENGPDQYRLDHKTNGWREADPPKLLGYVNDYRENFDGTDDNATKTDQFRRCVRYLLRWNDVRMPYEDEEKPTGLGFVLLAIQRGLSKTTFLDGRSDDRRALETFVRRVANTVGRVQADKPTPEYEEMFGRLGGDAMTQFKEDLKGLADALEEAGRTAAPFEACKELQAVFGEAFPVPPAEETARAYRAPAVVTSSTSA